MAEQQEPQNAEEQLPFLYVHRIPAFSLPFTHLLRNHFRLFDPLEFPDSTHSFLSRHGNSVRVLLCVGPSPLTSHTLSLLPSLELVVGTSAGIDHVDLAECKRRGLSVTSSGRAFSEDVADCGVGLLIDVLRRLSASDRYVRARLWPRNGGYPLGSKIGSRRVGIVGLGSIGSEIAKRLVPFGCSVAYHSKNKKPTVSYPYYPTVFDLATNSDVLIVSCALMSETRHIIDKDIMNALGTEGVIINIGRGALIDENELVQFLVRGDLGGAGLDVFKNESDVPKELFKLDNVVLSPHCAVLTPESLAELQKLVLGNLKAFFANNPLLSPVQL